MVEPHIGPVRRDVAVVACCIRLDVVRSLAPGDGVVVAGGARRYRRRVIETNARPACRYVTGIAVRIGRDMPERLARRDRIVVAITALRGQRLKLSVRVAAVATD